MTPATVTQGESRNDCGLSRVAAVDFGLGHACVVIRSPQYDQQYRNQKPLNEQRDCKPLFSREYYPAPCLTLICCSHKLDLTPCLTTFTSNSLMGAIRKCLRARLRSMSL